MTDEKKETKIQALRKWYTQSWVLDSIRRMYEAQEWEDLEAAVHRNVLFPLSKHDELPDYLRTEEGGPLFPSNLNPLHDHEGWQEAVNVGWEVMREQLKISKEEVQQNIRKEQDQEWDRFIASVEKRKKERRKSSPGSTAEESA
jgi:hypothetical protein